MKSKPCKFKKGLTLIEVMITLLIALIIITAVMGYMYASAINARAADVRITAARIGQLLLETWKITGHVDGSGKWSWNAIDFDPKDTDFNSALPSSFSDASVNLGGEGTELGDYVITIDSVQYFVTLLYNTGQPSMLSARVAWSRHSTAGNLGSDPEWVDVTGFAIY